MEGEPHGETRDERARRIRALWEKLDTKKKGTVDLPALKAGLTRLNHPLKDADGMIKAVLEAADINHDGEISYDEFLRFVTHTENELWTLFQNIDRDHSGKLDQDELMTAFRRAGVRVDKSRMLRFFSYIDRDHDGLIDFAEWRDFLLFLPAAAPSIEAVMSYYTSTVKVSAEGDVNLSDEALQGLGTASRSLPKFVQRSLFGAITQIASPSYHGYEARHAVVAAAGTAQAEREVGEERNEEDEMTSGLTTRSRKDNASHEDAWGEESMGDGDPHMPVKRARRKDDDRKKLRLTDFVPDIGYFIAGGISGITSRTSTAPLDRLKVYLIAQTSNSEAVQAAKSGAAVQATRHGMTTLVNACKELWAAGGIRSLFAGNGINIVKVMPESAVKFGSYEASKRFVAKVEGHDDPRHISGTSQFIAGGMAGMISQAVVYPLDTLKFRMQCETVAGGEHGNKLIWHTAQKMWARNGVSAFYKGLPMGLVGMFPYAAIDLGTFEFLKRNIVQRRMKNEGIQSEDDALPGNFSLALMGGFSGAIGASIVYPLNLLRTRLQSQGTAGHPRTYTGIVDVTRQTIKGEGVRGLFKGLTPNLLKVVPAVSITYVVYENCKRAMHLH